MPYIAVNVKSPSGRVVKLQFTDSVGYILPEPGCCSAAIFAGFVGNINARNVGLPDRLPDAATLESMAAEWLSKTYKRYWEDTDMMFPYGSLYAGPVRSVQSMVHDATKLYCKQNWEEGTGIVTLRFPKLGKGVDEHGKALVNAYSVFMDYLTKNGWDFREMGASRHMTGALIEGVYAHGWKRDA